MRTLFANAYIVTMDDAGTELPGWLLVDDGFVVAVGEGNPPPAEAFENLGGALVTPLGPLGIDWGYGLDQTDVLGQPRPKWVMHFKLGQLF